MEFVNYFNVLFKRHKDPCFIIDFDTNKVLYQNQAIEQLWQESIIGKNFIEILKNQHDLSEDYLSFDWDLKSFYECKFFNKSLNRGFISSFARIEYNGVYYILNKYESNDAKYDNIKFDFETAMSKCISLLQQDIHKKNDGLLKILGEYYDADKTFLYTINHENSSIPCVSKWVKDGIQETPNSASLNFDISQIGNWYSKRNEVGIVEVSKKHTSYKEGSTEALLLEAFNIDDVVMCILENSAKEPAEILVVINRENPNSDLRLLQAISNFLERDSTKSEMKSTVQKINNIDILTGFFSRVAYSQKIDNLELDPPKSLGVVFANVNGLKTINTEFGYAKGDSYIKKSATYIQNYFENDFYRISGDEFICFLPDIDKNSFDEKVTALLERMKIDENTSFALGYAWGSGRINVDNLIKEADTIMYINKQEYYHSSNRNFYDINDTTLSDLLSYLANDEFMIYLQPQVLLSDSSIYGAEALIRRFDKTNQKMVFPDQFISLYEKKSVIRHIDIFVVEQVCKLLAQWQKTNQAMPISVNLSRVTLQEYGIVDTIAKICDKYGISRQYLVIEVTERVGLIENNVASSLITGFKDKGFKISLDDFGCAYSNIITLAQIEVDEVKLDKSLVDDLTTSKKNYVLVKNVLSMCNELEDTSTLAEGIEDESQATLLHKLGCHLGQGYFYSRPIPVNEFCDKYIK